jgi:hypothetical protein
MLTTMVGFTFTSTAASAKPKPHYPPASPTLVVKSGVVNKGDTVYAKGSKFKARERITITVRFKPANSNRYRTLRTVSAATDRGGNFVVSVRASDVGVIVITAVGRSSHQTATATVSVIERRRWGRGRTWGMQPAAFAGGSDASVSAQRSPAPAEDDSGLTIAGLVIVSMAGGAFVAQRMVRRRRKADTAA